MPEIACPQCGKTGPVEKVSTIYVTGLGVRNRKKTGSSDSLAGRVKNPSEASALSARMAPPSSRKQANSRPIHPDQAVLIWTAVIPIFLWGIYTTQPGMLLPILVLLVGFYAVYFWQRKNLLVKFRQTQAGSKTADERIKHGIERWMRLYYCHDDDIVFEPGKTAVTPLDQMPGLLLKE